jgi:hypothetical protein
MKDGSTVCVPTAATPGDVHCDADAGVMLVGGDHCVSIITCGPGTSLDPDTNTCVSTGGATPHTPESCPTPTPGSICVNGVVEHFVDGSFLDASETVRVAVYEPLTFFSNPSAMPITESTTSDVFIFKNVTAPASGLVLLAITDPTGTATPIYQIAGVASKIVPGKSYRIDAFAVKKSDVAAWSASSGVDYDAKGAYVGRFFLDHVIDPTNQAAKETMPATGVKMIEAGGVELPGTQYFGANLSTVDPTATSTSAVGGAIVPPPASLDNFSGMGGGVATWESVTGGALPHTVLVQRFHPTP